MTSNTNKLAGSLNGIRVVDLSRVLGGPYCSQILADHGADVLKVEPPMGDETRGWGPPYMGETSAYFKGINRNKKGIVLDLRHETGQNKLFELLEDADVLLENFKSGTLEKWGIGKDFLQEKFPHLIHCCVSGFGADGPLGGLPGYDACAQAMCGLMSVNGEAGGEPTRVGLPVVDLVTGLNATIGILMAINEKRQSGKGQYIDVSLFDCAISLMHPHFPNYLAGGNMPKLTGNAHPNIAPYETFTTQEGEIFIAVGNNRQFSRMCDIIACPELPQDERFIDNSDRLNNREALREELSQYFKNFKASSLAEQLLKSGVPSSPVNNTAQILEHPHTHHREMIIEKEDYKGVNTPIKLSRTPASLRFTPPKFGEHNEEFGLDPVKKD